MAEDFAGTTVEGAPFPTCACLLPVYPLFPSGDFNGNNSVIFRRYINSRGRRRRIPVRYDRNERAPPLTHHRTTHHVSGRVSSSVGFPGRRPSAFSPESQ